MALHLKDCPPALRAKIEAALKEQYPAAPKLYAMATYLKGKWTVGPPTANKLLVEKLVSRFNLSNPGNCAQTLAGKPPAILVEI